MNQSDGLVITADNITIVPYMETTFPTPTDLLAKVRAFLGDVGETIRIDATIPEESRDDAFAKLFGSWVETGDEDRDLEELYQARLIPSSMPLDEE